MRNGINKRSGIHLVIEDAAKSPSIVSKGISVMPGTETNIGMQINTVLRLFHPYKSNCTNVYHNKKVEARIGSDFEYSSTVCKGLCLSLKFYETCDCMYTTMIEGFTMKNWFSRVDRQTAVRICNVTQGSGDYDCMSLAYHLVEKDTCGCKPECEEKRYKVRNFRKFEG